jgi:hypothetical protein
VGHVRLTLKHRPHESGEARLDVKDLLKLVQHQYHLALALARDLAGQLEQALDGGRQV